MKKLTAVVIGYGSRGSKYANYACEHPEELEIVAVADPLENRCVTAMEKHGLTEEQIYSDWKQLAELPKIADFAIIATQDNMHYEPALAMIEKGYHLLLEKYCTNINWNSSSYHFRDYFNSLLPYKSYSQNPSQC